MKVYQSNEIKNIAILGNDGAGKTMLNLRLAFSYTNISDKTKQICDELLDKFKMMPKHDITYTDNFQRLCIFSDENIKECKEEKGASSKNGVFAGGEAVTGAATVILAMGAGKAAANGIDEYLKEK